jgi:hypothetical protein
VDVAKPCRLCRLSDLPLRESHYLPAGLYRIVSGLCTNPNPVLVSATVTVSTSKQVTAPLLCERCEKRFDQGGEDWILKNCWRDEETFPLRDNLLAAGAVPAEELAVFEAAKIAAVDPSKVSYFAASIFWRGAAHRWTIQQKPADPLPFGPFQEAFRKYLLGGEWPERAALLVFVGAGMDQFRNITVALPHRRFRQAGYRLYAFTIPGMTFYLFLGGDIPFGIRHYSCATSPEGYILMSDQTDIANVQLNVKLFETTRKVGMLATKSADPTVAPSPWPAEEVLKRIRKRG